MSTPFLNYYRLNGVSISPAWNPQGRGEQSKSEEATYRWMAKGIAALTYSCMDQNSHPPTGGDGKRRYLYLAKRNQTRRNHKNANEVKHVGIALGIVR